MPGDPSKPLQQPTPDAPGVGQSAPANAVWDPVQQRWVGPASGAGGAGSGVGGPMPGATQRPAGVTWDAQNQGWAPASTAPSTGYAAPYGGPTGAQDGNGGPGTEGRVGSYDAHVGSGADWGGYIGTNVRNPDGSITFDPTQSGVQADINRFQGLASAAAGNKAYQNDYTQANQDAAMGAQDRAGQDAAIGMARDVANGGDTAAQQLGRNMLTQGVQTQQAAAMSTRGGSLAQAAAMQRQQGGQGAFMQQGQNQLAAQHADEMANARNQYAQMAGQQRAGDATAQGLHQQQAIGQMSNELGQRGLNQAGQIGYEQMGQNVDNASQDAALKNHEMDSGIDAAASLRATASAQRDQQQNAALIGAGGAGLAKFAAGSTASTDPNDPYKKAWDQANTTSDARAKVAIRPMGLAAAAARRRSA
jgi:hypothetical protein